MVKDNFIRRFEREHPSLKRLDSTPYVDWLLWAEKERYITLTRFEGTTYYTMQALEEAAMWATKMDMTFQPRDFVLKVTHADGCTTRLEERFPTPAAAVAEGEKLKRAWISDIISYEVIQTQ